MQNQRWGWVAGAALHPCSLPPVLGAELHRLHEDPHLVFPQLQGAPGRASHPPHAGLDLAPVAFTCINPTDQTRGA